MANGLLLLAPVLDTARLHLRTLVDDDAAALFAIHADPEAMRYKGRELEIRGIKI